MTADAVSPRFPTDLPLTRVGTELLPELPPHWMTYVDTEGSGLFGDGNPFKSGSNPPAPEARVSVVSVTFRWPVPVPGDPGNWTEGELVDYAWPFDQGPILGKPGRPVTDPETGAATFNPLTQPEVDKYLLKMSEYYGRTITYEEACANLPSAEYGALIRWLDRRDFLGFHNASHDLHVFRYGLRKGAGGDPSIPDGFLAWDPDSEPGQWVAGQPQRVGLMEPSSEPLIQYPFRRKVYCTLVVNKQLTEPLEVSALKPTANRLFGDDSSAEQEELKKELTLSKWIAPGMTKRYDILPWPGAMQRYAAKDTRLGHMLYEYQMQLAAEGAVLPRFWELLGDEMKLLVTLYRMVRRGVSYDVKASLAEGEKLKARNREIARRMPFDPSKIAQAKRFYFGPICEVAKLRFDHDSGEDADWSQLFCPKDCTECAGKNGLGYEPLSYTEKNKDPQLTIDGVKDLASKGAPFATDYARWSKNRNANSKWYTGWALRAGRDGKLRTSYKQTRADQERPGDAEGGTRSGRLAVGHIQLQAIPHGNRIPEDTVPVRKFIGVEPGYDLYEHDLATGEIRVVTILAPSYTLWDALDAGQDTHGLNTKAFFKIDENDPHWYDYRNAAKRGTFGLLYGGGVTALRDQMSAAAGIQLSLNTVKEATANFFEVYPEFQRMMIGTEQKVNRWKGGCGYLTMLDGWRRWYKVNEKTNSALNQVIQGNLARAVNQWMIQVEYELPEVLLLQIHDSLITRHPSTPEGRKDAQRVSEIGQEVFERYFAVRNRPMNWGIEPDLWADKALK